MIARRISRATISGVKKLLLQPNASFKMRYQYVLIDLIGIPIDPGPEPVYNADGDPQPWSEDLFAGNTNQSSDPEPERPRDLAFDSSSKGITNYTASSQPSTSERHEADPSLGLPSESTAIPPSPSVWNMEKQRDTENPSCPMESDPTSVGHKDAPFVDPSDPSANPKSDKSQNPLPSCLKKRNRKITNKVESESPLDVADPPVYLDADSATIPTPALPSIPFTESAAVPTSEQKVPALRSCLKKPKNTGDHVSFASYNKMKFYKPTSKLTSSRSSLGETMVQMKEGYSTWQYQLKRDHNLMQLLNIEPGEILDHRTDVHPVKLMKMMSEMAARGNTLGRKSQNIENTAHEDSAPPQNLPSTTACSYEQSSLDDKRSRNIAQKDVKWELPRYSPDRFNSEMTDLSCFQDSQSASISHLPGNNVLADSRLADAALNIENTTKEVNQPKLSDHDEVSVISDAVTFIEHKSKAIDESPDTSALSVDKMNFNIRTNNNHPTGKTNIRVINVAPLSRHMHRGVVDEERDASTANETPLLSRVQSPCKNTTQIPLSKSFYHQESGDTLDQEKILGNYADSKTYKQPRPNDAPVEPAAPDTIVSSSIILQQDSKTYKQQPRPIDNIVPSPIILQRDIDTHLDQDGLRDIKKNRSVSVGKTGKAGEMKLLAPAGDQPPSSRSIPSRRCASLMEAVDLKEASSVFPAETQRKPKHELKCRREDENEKPVERKTSDLSDRRTSHEKRPKRENSLPPQLHHQQDTKLLSDVGELPVNQKSDGFRSSLDTDKPGKIKTLANNYPTQALNNSSTSTLLSESQPAPKRQHFRKIPERPIDGKTSDHQFSQSYASANHCSRKKSGKAKFPRTTDDITYETKTKPKCRDKDITVHQPENPSEKLPADGKQSETKCHNAKTSRKTKGKDGYLSAANDRRTETSGKEDDKTVEDGNSFKKGDKRGREHIREETARRDKTTNENGDNAAHRSNGAGKRQKNRSRNGSITRKVKKAWEQTVSGGTNSESIASKPCDNTPFHGGTITKEAVRNRFKAREYTARCEKDGVKAVRIVARMLNSGKDLFEKPAKENDKKSTGQGNKSQDNPHVVSDKTDTQTCQKQKPGKIRRLFTSICDKVKRIGKQQTTESATTDILPLADIPSRCLKKVDTEGTKERMNVQFAAERLYSISKEIPCMKSSLGESAVKMKETCEHVQIGRMGKGSKLLWRGKLAGSWCC